MTDSSREHDTSSQPKHTYIMTKHILPYAVSLVILCGAARGDEVVTAPVIIPDAEPVITVTPVENTGVEVVVKPIPVICTDEVVVEELPAKTDVTEPELVTGEVEGVTLGDETVIPPRYSGSEVERGGEVNPVLMYSSGVMTLGGAGSSNLEQGISGNGLEAVAALKIDVTEPTKPARELKVLDRAGDIVISD